jgi:hypothetical protein
MAKDVLVVVHVVASRIVDGKREVRHGNVQIEIDTNRVAYQSAGRALFSKGGKATFCEGAIVVRKAKE